MSPYTFKYQQFDCSVGAREVEGGKFSPVLVIAKRCRSTDALLSKEFHLQEYFPSAFDACFRAANAVYDIILGYTKRYDIDDIR